MQLRLSNIFKANSLSNSIFKLYTAFPLSHYANGFSHSPYGNSCIEAKPQRKLHRTAPSMKNFLRIMRLMEMVPPVKSN